MSSPILFDSSLEEEGYGSKIIINSLQSLNSIISINSYNSYNPLIRLESTIAYYY